MRVKGSKPQRPIPVHMPAGWGWWYRLIPRHSILPQLLPRAIAWAEAREAEALKNRTVLPPNGAVDPAKARHCLPVGLVMQSVNN